MAARKTAIVAAATFCSPAEHSSTRDVLDVAKEFEAYILGSPKPPREGSRPEATVL
jgi:hypothetical protein